MRKIVLLFVGLVSMAAFAKALYEEPGKPSIPCIINFDRSHCELEYRPPLSDGGSPITSYIIEKKSGFWSSWAIAIEVPKPKLRCKVVDLIEGDRISFRVKAKNKIGLGEPSDASDPITIRDR